MKMTPLYNMRRCKIIGTIGPASCSEETFTQLVEAGLDIARLNFSHGTHDTHRRNIELIRKVADKLSKSITILQDLQGPKIRCGYLQGDAIKLEKHAAYSLAFGSNQSEKSVIPIDYADLVKDVMVGQRVMMDDGLLILEVTDIVEDAVQVRVLEGGVLRSRKGVNFPDSILSLPILSEKDTKDLIFGINHHVDIVALSFVQTPEDVTSCQKMISALGADTPVIAKIEKISAVEKIDEIAEVADGIMIARGDLGVEGQIEKVPSFQRRIIHASMAKSKPVIVATQMLESMTVNAHATFAERSDMANAVLEGVDCLMLSAEVATGAHPVACVATMDATIREVEKWIRLRARSYPTVHVLKQEMMQTLPNQRDVVALAACEASQQADARAIVCVSLTGSIAYAIARWRPNVPIITLCPRKEVIQRLGLTWGVLSIQNPIFYNTDVMIQSLPDLLKKLAIVESGDVIVITAGIPINHLRSTNMIKINTIP